LCWSEPFICAQRLCTHWRRAISKAALDQASGSAHEDEVTKEFTYTRREAEALIGIAAASSADSPSGPAALKSRRDLAADWSNGLSEIG
jgi:hypothetical protein